MEKKLNKLQIFCCKLIGWNPEMLANCGEASFRTMKKFVGSIVILSIIWGTIGYCFADRYIGIESFIGRGVVAAAFVTIIVCIERFIILNDGGKMVYLFRILLALLMSTLGSTIFDQLIFKRDVEAIMKEVRTEQINEEVPKRMNIVNAEIERTSSELDSLGLLIERFNEKIGRTSAQISTSDVTKQLQKDSLGKNVEVGRSISTKKIINPRFVQLNEERKLLGEEANRQREKQKELFEKKMNIEENVRAEYENMENGFLEELRALFRLLQREPIALLFYICLFTFLTSLELLVLFSKGERCDYELVVLNQRDIREEKMKRR